MTENDINNCEITKDFLSASIYDILLTLLKHCPRRDDVLKIRIANTSRPTTNWILLGYQNHKEKFGNQGPFRRICNKH